MNTRWSPSYLLNLSPTYACPTSDIQQVASAYNPLEQPSSPPLESLKTLIQRSMSPHRLFDVEDSASLENTTAEAFPNAFLDEALEVLRAPRSFDNIRHRMALSNNTQLPLHLRIELALSIPKNVESNRLILDFTKDESLDICLRTRCALGLLPSLEKYSLIKACLNTPCLNEELKLECLFKLVKNDPENITKELLFSYLSPFLKEIYRHSIAHPQFMNLFRKQIAYDDSRPLLFRAKCALKSLPAQDHTTLFEVFAKSPALPIAFRVSFAAALPKGSSRDALAKTLMEDPDVELRTLWVDRLPAEEKEQALRRFLVEPNLSKELQYFCASKLREGPIRQVYMELFAQDTTFPIELQINAARNVLNPSIKGDLLTHFAQREEIALFFRLPCILEMPKGELRNRLLSRFAQDTSLDVNFRVPCIVALAKGPLKTDLLKIALRNTALHLPRIKQALKYLPPEEKDFKNNLACTFALNSLLPPFFRYECAQLLSQDYPHKSQLEESLKRLISS